MMTASSVEFFPCRVQHMGLRSAPASGATTTTLQTPPRRPPMEKLHGVSRNLFGSPEPGEINSMFQQETKRHHSYVFQRYNIDINALRAKIQPTNAVAAPRQPTQLPTLIAHELKQHEQRLQKEECNLNRAAPASEITPPNAKIQQQGCAVVSKIMRRCCGDDGLTPTSTTSMERQKLKPYARQPMLTESFNLRKNKICSPSSSLSSSLLSSSSSLSSSQTVANAETLSLHRLTDTHRNVQVLKLPQAMQAEWKGDINEVTTTNDKAEDDTAEEGDADEDCNTSSQRQRSTTLSLKLVVSTQNAAPTTTSSTSREHKHHA